jgi:hypothetical protein
MEHLHVEDRLTVVLRGSAYGGKLKLYVVLKRRVVLIMGLLEYIPIVGKQEVATDWK